MNHFELEKQAKNYLQSEEFKKLVPFLLSGGAAAVAGGAMSGRRREERKESRKQYLGRILRNAVIAGGLASGGHYLLNKGFGESATSALNAAERTEEDTGGPAESVTRSLLFNDWLAPVYGTIGLGLTRNRPTLGMGINDRKAKAKNLKSYARRLGVKTDWISGATADEIAKKTQALHEKWKGVHPPSTKVLSPAAQRAALQARRHAEATAASELKKLEKARRHAGIASSFSVNSKEPSRLKGALSVTTRSAPVKALFGNTGWQRAGRAGVFGAAAMLPSLLGAAFSDPTD